MYRRWSIEPTTFDLLERPLNSPTMAAVPTRAMGDIVRTDAAAFVYAVAIADVGVSDVELLVLAFGLSCFQLLLGTFDNSVVCLDCGESFFHRVMMSLCPVVVKWIFTELFYRLHHIYRLTPCLYQLVFNVF